MAYEAREMQITASARDRKQVILPMLLLAFTSRTDYLLQPLLHMAGGGWDGDVLRRSKSYLDMTRLELPYIIIIT